MQLVGTHYDGKFSDIHELKDLPLIRPDEGNNNGFQVTPIDLLLGPNETKKVRNFFTTLTFQRFISLFCH